MPNTREKLIELLAKYFDIGDSYAYNLTRVKSAFACGTMGFDDFEEFDEETVADIADHLIANGVTFAKDNNVPNKWIPVTERLPENEANVLAYSEDGEEGRIFPANYAKKIWWDCIFNIRILSVTHWMPLPEPLKGE